MKKNLIIRLSAMGDVAMVAPVLESVIRLNPDEKFLILTSNRFDAFFSHLDNVECICVSKDTTSGVKSMLRFFLDINRNHDSGRVIDLHGVLRSKILGYLFKLIGVPVFFIDKNRKSKKGIIEKEVTDVRLPKVAQFYADLLSKSGLKVEFEDKLNLQVRDISDLDDRYKKTIATERFIGFAPFAQHDGKKLPEYKIEELVIALLRNENNRIFMFGGSSHEREICEKIAASTERVVSVVGALSLSDELRFISNLDIMVSMDSGAQHMASLVGVRAVTIWGATNPSIGFLGVGQSYDDCVIPDISCNPCSAYGNRPCYRDSFPYECLHTVSIEKVVELVEKDR